MCHAVFVILQCVECGFTQDNPDRHDPNWRDDPRWDDCCEDTTQQLEYRPFTCPRCAMRRHAMQYQQYQQPHQQQQYQQRQIEQPRQQLQITQHPHNQQQEEPQQQGQSQNQCQDDKNSDCSGR